LAENVDMVFEIMEKIKVAAGLGDPVEVPPSDAVIDEDALAEIVADGSTGAAGDTKFDTKADAKPERKTAEKATAKK
ncbi:MAG: hypothetical protein WEC34_13090, partial [Acidimicrobiia bacterium]